MKKIICTSTIKFVAKDESKTHTTSFTVEDGDWCRLNGMIDDYIRKKFPNGELLHFSHLAHGSFVVNDY